MYIAQERILAFRDLVVILRKSLVFESYSKYQLWSFGCKSLPRERGGGGAEPLFCYCDGSQNHFNGENDLLWSLILGIYL